jgi:hypothetical protein
MSWHATLSLERWQGFPLETRLLMIQNEIHRARNAQKDGYYGSIRLAFERALELVDLTVATRDAAPILRAILIWRDAIARAYLFPEDLIPESLMELPRDLPPEPPVDPGR